MRLVLRVLIVLAAMIAGGWTAGELAGRVYIPYSSPNNSCCLAAASFTMVVIIPAEALVAGAVALILTRKRNRRNVR